MSTHPAIIGVDVGGTVIKGGVFSLEGVPLHQVEVASPAAGGEELLDATASTIATLQAWSAGAGRSCLQAGVVVPGVVDDAAGQVLFAANLRWRDLALTAALQDRCGLPVVLGHDVRSAALAERTAGAARELDDFLLVTIGTGISSAIHTAGTTRAGATAAAGELGHIPVVVHGEPCHCGQRGCLEVYASAGGLVRRYRAAGGPTDATAASVASLSGKDALAGRIWADATSALASALTTATLLIDPAVILLGGGLAQSGEVLLSPTAARLREGLRWRAPPPLRLSSLGSGAGRVGAALLALRASGHAADSKSWPDSLATPGPFCPPESKEPNDGSSDRRHT